MSIIRKDDQGNVIGCPYCGSRSIKKDGWHYQKKEKKQRWRCTSCNRNTLTPKVLEKSPFAVDEKPIEFAPIQELITHREKLFDKKKEYKAKSRLFNIYINVNGPIGIAHFGDPHVDDDGTDLSMIIKYSDVINATEGMYAGNLGDI